MCGHIGMTNGQTRIQIYRGSLNFALDVKKRKIQKNRQMFQNPYKF